MVLEKVIGILTEEVGQRFLNEYRYEILNCYHFSMAFLRNLTLAAAHYFNFAVDRIKEKVVVLGVPMELNWVELLIGDPSLEGCKGNERRAS